MSLLIKICGLRDKRHVAVAIEAGAEAIGFVFAESSRKVTPEVARSISDVVPRSVKRVAVMLHPAVGTCAILALALLIAWTWRWTVRPTT